MCDSKSLNGEIQYLNKTFRQNGYSEAYMPQVLNPKQRTHSQWQKLARVITVPFMQGASNKMSRLLVRFSKRTTHIPVKKNAHLRPLKDALFLKVTGIYCIPCVCGRVYKGHTDCSIKIRC